MLTKIGVDYAKPPTDIDAMIMMLEFLQESATALSPPADEVRAALVVAIGEALAYKRDGRTLAAAEH